MFADYPINTLNCVNWNRCDVIASMWMNIAIDSEFCVCVYNVHTEQWIVIYWFELLSISRIFVLVRTLSVERRQNTIFQLELHANDSYGEPIYIVWQVWPFIDSGHWSDERVLVHSPDQSNKWPGHIIYDTFIKCQRSFYRPIICILTPNRVYFSLSLSHSIYTISLFLCLFVCVYSVYVWILFIPEFSPESGSRFPRHIGKRVPNKWV